jgi:hypothetical protein
VGFDDPPAGAGGVVRHYDEASHFARQQPLWPVIEQAWYAALEVSPWWDGLELFLSPADCEGLGRPASLLLNGRDVPVRVSVGVPEGSALVFDRRALRYYREGAYLR